MHHKMHSFNAVFSIGEHLLPRVHLVVGVDFVRVMAWEEASPFGYGIDGEDLIQFVIHVATRYEISYEVFELRAIEFLFQGI